MPREMFAGAEPARTTRQRYAVPLSIVTHAAALCALVVVPLVATNTIPSPNEVIVFVTTPPPPPAPPPPAPPPTPSSPAPPAPVAANVDAAPTEPPRMLTPDPPRTLAVPARGIEESVAPAAPGVSLAPPPVQEIKTVRPGGDIQPPRKLRDALPNYPAAARAARIAGVVIIEATIAADGSVKDARVLRGNPLLDQAALDAVSQWRFSPTRLNGVPVEVIMSVTVNFRLQ